MLSSIVFGFYWVCDFFKGKKEPYLNAEKPLETYGEKSQVVLRLQHDVATVMEILDRPLTVDNLIDNRLSELYDLQTYPYSAHFQTSTIRERKVWSMIHDSQLPSDYRYWLLLWIVEVAKFPQGWESFLSQRRYEQLKVWLNNA